MNYIVNKLLTIHKANPTPAKRIGLGQVLFSSYYWSSYSSTS